MRFCILFALACICPVAFSHKQYVAIPISALKNGRADSERNAVVYDISALQVRTVGAGGNRAGRQTTSVRRSSTNGRGSGEASARGSTFVRAGGPRSIGSIRRAADSRIGTINMITSQPRVAARGSIRKIARGRTGRHVNLITRPSPSVAIGSIRRIAGDRTGRNVNLITRTPTRANRGSIRKIARDRTRSHVNLITRPSPSVAIGSIRRIAGDRTGRNVNLIKGTPPIINRGSIGRIAGGRAVGRINVNNLITSIPALTRTDIPTRTRTYVNGNVRYVTSVSPSYTSISPNYVNSGYQPHIVTGSLYQPTVTSNGYFVTWPRAQSSSFVVNAAIQQPLINSQQFRWPLDTDPMSSIDPLSEPDFAVNGQFLNI